RGTVDLGGAGHRALVLPAFGARPSEIVRVLSDAGLAGAALPWRVAPERPVVTLVVKATCELVPDEAARPRPESDFCTGDVHADDDPEAPLLHPSDLALVKPRVDVAVVGHAYAPGGAATAMRVSLRVGSALERTVAVLGDRTWRRGVLGESPSEPASFDRIPLTWQRAFGGPGHPANPHGVGFRGATRDGRALPNVERPERLLTRAGDEVPPAGLAPLPATHPARLALVGTYDAEWLRTRWPCFARDFDAAFFQAAPPELQLESLRGDEPFELTGLAPDRASLCGRLPGVRARAFAQRTAEADGALVEVPLRLDTLLFAPDAGTLTLVWRGRIDVTDVRAPELALCFATLEPLDAPLPREAVEARLAARLAEESPAEFDLAGRRRELERLLQVRAAERAAFLRAAPPAANDRTRVPELLATGQPLDGVELGGVDLAGADLAARSFVGADLRLASLRGARLGAAVLRQARLAGTDLRAADLRGADLTGADLTGALLDGAVLDGARLDEAIFTGARAASASFGGARGANVRFEEGHFAGASFAGARLADADFTASRLAGARFTGAELPDLRLYDASAPDTHWDGATLPRARGDGVDLSGASFADARLDGAVFEGATLERAVFRGASLRGANLGSARCDAAVFAGADLRSGRLAAATLAGADLRGADLLEATLERADLSRADLRGANLHGAGLRGAKLAGARLEGAITTKSSLGRRAAEGPRP
ncbi:MAG: DUF2169 domain-containing protein, partial [Myxococcales bacterium]|nr:DUF2169 domain-containing protein [Myxococcales bacterium]